MRQLICLFLAAIIPGCTSAFLRGQVTDQFGEPVAGQDLQVAGAGIDKIISTDAAGRYVAGVPFGWSGVARLLSGLAVADVTPADHYTYTAVTGSIAAQDFVAVWRMFTISGKIMLRLPGQADAPLPDVLLIAVGTYRGAASYSTQATTAPDGSYSLSVPYGWTGTVTPQANVAYGVQVVSVP